MLYCIFSPEFKGEPDPLRGDQIYSRVRDAARETLDAVFDSQQPVTTSAVAAANRIQGMGNDYIPEEKEKKTFLSSVASSLKSAYISSGGSEDVSYVGHPGSDGGFGASSPDPNNMRGRSISISSGVVYKGPSDSTGGGGGGGGGGSYPSAASASATSFYSTTESAPSGSFGGIGNPNFTDPRNEKSWYDRAKGVAEAAAGMTMSPVAGSVSPVANVRSEATDYSYATNRGPTAHGMMADFNPPASMSESGVGRAGTAQSYGSYERTIIDSLCESGGLKAVPAEDKLQSFILAAHTLSADIVGSCLLDG